MKPLAAVVLPLLLGCGPRLHSRAVLAPVLVRELPTPRVAAKDSGETIELPRPTGPYAIGRATFHAVDVTRDEPFTTDAADHREVVFQIFYPALASKGVLAAFIAPLPDDTVFRRSYSFIGFERLARIRSHSFANAPVLMEARPYPVILFSHGLGGISAMYTTFQENLASHGYIVVGVDHPFFSAAFRLPDGRTVRNLSRPAFRQRDVIAQAVDLSFVLDVLEHIRRDATNPLGRTLDLELVGVFGHSRGGFASPHACRRDRRFKACANLDGWELTPAVTDSGITQPYMHVEEIAPWEPAPTDSELVALKQTRAEYDVEARSAAAAREATFRRMKSGTFLVVVHGAKHLSFSDQAFIAPDRYRDIKIDARRALEITNAYLLAFFDRFLKNQPQALLEGRPPFPEVTLEKYRGDARKEVYPGTPR